MIIYLNKLEIMKMNKYLKQLILLLMIVMDISAVIASDKEKTEAEKIEIVTLASDFWPPYAFTEQDDNLGYLVELISESLAKFNIKLNYISASWAEAIDMAAKGEIDGIIGATKNELSDFIFTRDPLAYGFSSAYSLKSYNWRYKGIESLHEQRLGFILGYRYPEILNNYIFLNYPLFPEKFLASNGLYALEQNISNLLQSKIDVIIENEAVMNYWIKNNQNNQIHRVGRISFNNEELYVALSPKLRRSFIIRDLINHGYNLIRNEGMLLKLQQKYQIHEFKRGI